MAVSHAAILGASLDLVRPQRALLSVSDKTGLVELASALAAVGCELVSTGGTAQALRDAGLTVRDVSELSGVPEMLNCRVKTLVPAVHAGLLAVRGNPEHAAQLATHGLHHIDLVCVNLYPFAATVAKGADFATCVENIDIGGPAMIRSGSKNHAAVAVLTAPAQYARVVAALQAAQGTTLALRKTLAAEAFAATAAYDTSIAEWFAKQF